VAGRTPSSAETIASLYRFRWQIEIFFRWLKHILGCRHLISHGKNGIELQVYAAIIVCLLIARYSGLKPNKATYEMVHWSLCGWASEEELMNHIAKTQSRQGSPSR